MYNEEFMLPYWLRHYETIADRIFIWDGGSTDKTLEILSHHPKVTLLPRDEPGHSDHYYVTTLYPQYEKYSRGVAEWVMIADADEFVYHPHVREVLKKAKKDGLQMIQCSGFSMISEKLPRKDGQIYDEIKTGIPDSFESKWTIFSPDICMRYRKGRHGTPYNRRQFMGSRDTGIKLLHYRYLTKEYIQKRERKNMKGIKIAYPGHTWSFTLGGPRSMPNGEEMNIYQWLTKHRGEACNVLET
ncbi:glycosyltransferase family 2 protein [Candidatus Microgenomates bacterium]|nr:glycosyltransferase family 2 protein [Candidatus Microgenomates bacterium]